MLLRMRLVLVAACVISPLLTISAMAGEGDAAQMVKQSVADYRKTLVLLEDASYEFFSAQDKENAARVGKYISSQNHQRLERLQDMLRADVLAAKAAPPKLAWFLSDVETNPDYRDGDKLVFLDMMEELADLLRAEISNRPALKPWLSRVEDDHKILLQIQALYEKELEKIFARMEMRGMVVKREAWDSYIKYLRGLYKPQDVLKEYSYVYTETRGLKKSDDKIESSSREISGRELPPKTLVVTFDDGPHAQYTDRIREILARFDMPPTVFFEVGSNLGSIKKDGSIKLTAASKASYRLLESGAVLANHTYSHALLTKLTPAAYIDEISVTNVLLKHITQQPTVLFRAPYGARNQEILSEVNLEQLRSVMWNIDSKDWADPIPSSIANRVIKGVREEGRGIILFHDIHKSTVQALPLVLETLKAEGYRFASWDGSQFSVPKTRATSKVPTPQIIAKAASPYRESWAVVIGIDQYTKWPKLRYAVNDAQGVKDLLIKKYSFKPENVFTLFDEQATRENILTLLGDKLGNPDMVKHDDRVLVFFAGHGATRKLPSGRDLGYIVPMDGDIKDYHGKAISMTNFQDIAEAIPAKHVLFVMDSCYSGLALTRGGGSNYLQEMTRRSARQMFTAGGANQEVADGGPNGHSVFTWTLLQALEGKGDLNGDGYITASELAAYTGPIVSSLSRQTPAFGNLAGSEGGEFVFQLRHEDEFLNAQSTQLGEDGIRVNKEIAQLRAELLEKNKLNEKLQKDVAQLTLKNSAHGIVTAPTTGVDSALQRNDKGVAAFKEKRYQDALNEFLAGYKLDPTIPLITNNAGFAYFKLEQYPEAIEWFNKTLQLDPNRAVAYLNLGDAAVKLERNAEAKKAYLRYLELQPKSRLAPQVQEKLKALN